MRTAANRSPPSRPPPSGIPANCCFCSRIRWRSSCTISDISILAWWSAFWCARAFGLSRGAAAFAGTAYAFPDSFSSSFTTSSFSSAPPGCRSDLAAIDRIVRRPSFGAALGLAAILAMQILGGDPEVAILTLLVGLPYLLLFHSGRQGFWWGVGLLCLGHAAVFIGRCLPPFEFSSEAYLNPDAKTLALGWFAAALKYPGDLLTELIAAVTYRSEYGVRIGGRVHTLHLYFGWTGITALVAGAVLLLRGGGFRALWRSQSLRMWLMAGVVAGLLSAVQILPTRELVGVSDRSAPKAPHESAAFSLFPARLLETAIPAVFGRQMPIHTRWAPFAAIENGLWTASLYMGLPAVVLGLAMLRFRKGSSHAVWLTWTFLLMLWLAVGKYGGLYWLVDPQSGHLNRPIDAPRDAKMYGVSDGLYRLCEEAIPMFASFRYPEKCFLFCTLALALLAAVGIDAKIFRHPRLQRVLVGAVAIVAGLLFILWIARGPFERFIAGLRIPSTGFGPLDPANAWNGLMQSLVHAGFAAAAMLRVGPNNAAHRVLVDVAAGRRPGDRESLADLFRAAGEHRRQTETADGHRRGGSEGPSESRRCAAVPHSPNENFQSTAVHDGPGSRTQSRNGPLGTRHAAAEVCGAMANPLRDDDRHHGGLRHRVLLRTVAVRHSGRTSPTRAPRAAENDLLSARRLQSLGSEVLHPSLRPAARSR